jgi:hypothetical protein
MLSQLFNIGVGDELQSTDKLEFLVDQRGERKSRLPPLIGKVNSMTRQTINGE